MAHSADAPLIFVSTLPVLIAVALAEMSSGGIDSNALAMLGVVSAVDVARRTLGAGTAGIETVFFVLAGRVFGPVSASSPARPAGSHPRCSLRAWARGGPSR